MPLLPRLSLLFLVRKEQTWQKYAKLDVFIAYASTFKFFATPLSLRYSDARLLSARGSRLDLKKVLNCSKY